MSNWQVVFILGYIFSYFGLVIGWVYFLRRRRKTKWPFKETDKLLRTPGEGLRRRLLEFDEAFLLEFCGFIIVAMGVWPLTIWLMQRLGFKGTPVVVGVLIGMLIVALASVWRIGRMWQRRAAYFLGWFGERMTAEKLQPLQLQGYRVFHDVPCQPGKNGFNIDHVVVGATGVAAVEVKTRRKGNARPGYKDHEVAFNGEHLDWPWGHDRHGIEQALNQAEWLGRFLFERTGLRVPVKAVLALPDWYVREAPSPKLRVVNPSILPDAIRGRGEVVLTTQQIDLFSRQLETLCRDVED